MTEQNDPLHHQRLMQAITQLEAALSGQTLAAPVQNTADDAALRKLQAENEHLKAKQQEARLRLDTLLTSLRQQATETDQQQEDAA